MNQLLIGMLILLGLGSYYLYTENQTLAANNSKLELAVEEQKQAMEAIKEQYEKQGKALLNMSRKNSEKAEYLSIFSRHNLDLLALKKPGMIELRFNNASEKVMEGLENDTEELYKLTVPATSN